MALTAVSVLLQVRDRLLSRSESCKLSSFCRVTCRASSNVECIMWLILVPPHVDAAALRSSTHGVDCRIPESQLPVLRAVITLRPRSSFQQRQVHKCALAMP